MTPAPGTADQKFQNSLGMNAKLKVSQTQNQINIEWGKVSGADGYNVYATYCGQSYTKKSISQVKKGKTATIKAKTILVDKSKKQLSDAHAKEFCYETSNKKVAKVNANGKVEAVGKGTCYIYVYARNGFAKRVKVTVK